MDRKEFSGFGFGVDWQCHGLLLITRLLRLLDRSASLPPSRPRIVPTCVQLVSGAEIQEMEQIGSYELGV